MLEVGLLNSTTGPFVFCTCASKHAAQASIKTAGGSEIVLHRAHQRFRLPKISQTAAMPSSRRREPPSSSSAPSEARDWAALPQDILLTVFLKLGPCEIMQGAELVCTMWRRVAVDEPLLWRSIDMGTVSTLSPVGRAVACAALNRGAGQCESFSGSCDDDMLPYLVERAPSLKSLHLSCFDGPNQVLVVVLKNLSLLEDLEVSPSLLSIGTENLLESVCQACPLLRKLRVRFSIDENYFADEEIREKINGIFTTMCELLSLELLNCDLTVEGLAAILDHCPVLESLYITGCFGGEMDAELRGKCAKVKNLTLPYGPAEEYYNDEDYEWRNDDEFGITDHGLRDYLHYNSWEMPYHPQYHYFCDDLDLRDIMDFRD
ncbi:putative F-box/LRR-repeat protein 9 isoform X3 [Miscanthus floridulus]